ncbi:hypothetical protein HK102_003069, partial [Quaeritorhiza haematococci]
VDRQESETAEGERHISGRPFNVSPSTSPVSPTPSATSNRQHWDEDSVLEATILRGRRSVPVSPIPEHRKEFCSDADQGFDVIVEEESGTPPDFDQRELRKRDSVLTTLTAATTTPADPHLFDEPEMQDEEEEHEGDVVEGRHESESAIITVRLDGQAITDSDSHTAQVRGVGETVQGTSWMTGEEQADGDGYPRDEEAEPIRGRRNSAQRQQRGTSSHIHLEPPMTRVPGILDAPLESSIPVIPDMDEQEFMFVGDLNRNPSSLLIRRRRKGKSSTAHQTASTPRTTRVEQAASSGSSPNGSGVESGGEQGWSWATVDTDLQLHTYLHPALIGRLPIAWIPGHSQPRSLMDAREEQSRKQLELWQRIVGRQRVFDEDEEEAFVDEDVEDSAYGAGVEFEQMGGVINDSQQNRRHRLPTQFRMGGLQINSQYPMLDTRVLETVPNSGPSRSRAQSRDEEPSSTAMRDGSAVDAGRSSVDEGDRRDNDQENEARRLSSRRPAFRRRARTRTGENVLLKVRSFMDGISSWAHLQLS